jgi:hypothetical protein
MLEGIGSLLARMTRQRLVIAAVSLGVLAAGSVAAPPRVALRLVPSGSQRRLGGCDCFQVIATVIVWVLVTISSRCAERDPAVLNGRVIGRGAP